jgi:hypothetical protein
VTQATTTEEALRQAINRAYSVLCSGNPPHSPREANARRILRQVGAVVLPPFKPHWLAQEDARTKLPISRALSGAGEG